MEKTPDTAKMMARMAGLSRQRKDLLAFSSEEAMQRILESAQPAALVHSFPEQDFHFLIHDIGPEDALPLLALASDRQWEYLLDMETWRRDRLDAVALTRWLELLYRAGTRRTIKWLIEHKTDLLTLYLFGNIEVRLLEQDQDPSDFGEDFFTLDSVFYVRIVGPLFTAESDLGDIEKENYREFLTKLIHSLAAFDHIAYQMLLLEAAAYIIPAENEEEAYRLRNVRLAEKGFLPFEEAVGVYQPLSPRQLTERGRMLPAPSAPATGLPVPLYPAGVLDGGSLFARALSRIDAEALLEQLQTEFAGLCNRIIAADVTPVHRKDDLRQVVQKTSGFLSIGMQALAAEAGSGGPSDRDVPVALIVRHRLSDIFRTGYGQALELKWRAQRWLDRSWFAGQGLSLTFWGEDWLGVLGGLLVKKPVCYDNYASGRMYRDFATLEELRQTGEVLETVMACDHLLSLLKIPPELLAAGRFITYKNLVLTLWALEQTTGSGQDRYLTRGEFERFFGRLWQEKKRPRRIAAVMKQSFASWLGRRSGLTARRIAARIGPVAKRLMAEIEEEYGLVDTADLDPRYIHLFLVER